MVAIQAQDTEDRVLDAAERCVRLFGLTRWSMSDVAATAEVARGTVYRYFPDRDAVVAAVLARTAERFVASSEASVRRRRSLATQVAEAAAFIVEHRSDPMLNLDLPSHGESAIAALRTAHLTSLAQRWIDFWIPMLELAEERGEIRPGLDHRQTGEWIVRLLFSFAVMPPVAVDLTRPAEIRSFITERLVAGLD